MGRAVIARDEKLISISRGKFMTHARQGHGGQAGRADVLTNLVRSLAGRLIGWSLAFGHQVGSEFPDNKTAATAALAFARRKFLRGRDDGYDHRHVCHDV